MTRANSRTLLVTSVRFMLRACAAISMSKPRERWKYFVAMVPAAQPKPDSTAHSFGASAPYERLYEEFGITAANVVALAKEKLG